MRKFVLLTLFLFIAGGVILAQDVEPTVTGDLRVVNAMPGIGPVDIYVNDLLIGNDLQPGQASPFLALSPGQYNVAVYPAGVDRLSIPIADDLLELSAGNSKTAIAYETRFRPPLVEGEEENTSFVVPGQAYAQAGAIHILDDNRSPVQLGKTRVTAVHLAQGNPGKLSIAYPSRASLLHEVSLGQPYGDIDIDAGVYSLTVVDAESSLLSRLNFIGEEVFDANVHYTMIIVPDVQPSLVNDQPVLPLLNERPTVFVIDAPIEPPVDGIQVRFIHAAHDTDLVDVYVDGRLTAPRLTFGEYTPYLGMAGYGHLIELRRRDAAPESEPLATARFSITPENQLQQHWTVLLLNGDQVNVAALDLIQAQDPVFTGESASSAVQVFNTAGGPVTLVLLPDNISQTPRSTSRVRLLHAIDGALEISLFALGVPSTTLPPTPIPGGATPTPVPPVNLIIPVIYGVEANESEIPAGTYETLDFIAGSTTELLSLSNHQFLPGMVHTFVLIGQPSGEPSIRMLEITDYGRGLPNQRLYSGVVSTDENVAARVRSRPSTASTVVAQLLSGSEVEVLGRNVDGSWIQIRYTLPNVEVPQDGWIAVQLVAVTRLGEPINPLALPQSE